MSGSAGNLSVTIGADARLLTNGMQDAAAALETGMARMNRAIGTLNKSNRDAADSSSLFSGALGGLTKGIPGLVTSMAAAAAGSLSLVAGFKAATSAAEQFQRLGMRTEAIIKATGSTAGLTGAEIRTMSQELARSTLASTEGVEAAAQKLLTFRNISGDTFKRTLVAAQDLAATGFGSIDSAAMQLGKALEDPIKGLTALGRSGVSFSAAQKEVIQTLVATGQAAEAQRLILAAVEKQVGGAGAAEAGGLAGAYDSLGQNVQEFLVKVGNLGPIQLATGAINVMAGAVDGLTRALRFLSEQSTQEEAIAAAQASVATARSGAAGVRRGSVRQGLVGMAASQAGEDPLSVFEAQAQAAEIRLIQLQEDMERGRVDAATRGAEERARIERDAAASALAAMRASYDKRIGIEATYNQQVATIRRAQAAGELTAAQATDELTAAMKRRDEALTATVKKAKTEKPDDDLLAAAKVAMEFEKAQDAAAKGAERVLNSLDPARAALSAYTANVEALNVALDAGALSQEQFAAGIDLAEKSYSEAQKKLADAGQSTDQVFAKLSSSFEAALTSGKSLGDVFKALTDDLAKLIIKLTITEPLARAVKDAFNGAGGSGGIMESIGSAIFGAPVKHAMGGVMTSDGPVPLRKYAKGGIANSPQMALFGEGAGAEAFVPLPDGRRIPVQMSGGGGGVTIGHIDARGADAGVERRIQQGVAMAVEMGSRLGEQRVYAAANRGGAAARTLGRR
jgi:phage-related minor tail protein